MKVTIVCKGKFDALPPAMSAARVIKELGHDVEVVTSCVVQSTKCALNDNGIKIVELSPEQSLGRSGLLRKIGHWKDFSERAWRYIDMLETNSLLWISTADTALALGKRLFGQHYVLQLLELYDTHPLYRRFLAKYARHASCVVVPEMCRGAILRSWFGLQHTPIVLPNKPAVHPRQRYLLIEDTQAKALLSSLRPAERIVLYQGHLGFERDILPVAEAIRRMGSGWQFVVMGPGNAEYIALVKRNYPEVIYIPRVNAPFHLQITSHAAIGVIVYGWDKLNNVFCAPNKTWEYAGFGLPMLCSDLPTLQLTVQADKAGICVDMSDTSQIVAALQQIEHNYEYFGQASSRFYDTVDIHAIIQLILNRAG